MKIDKNRDYRGMVFHMTMPLQPFPSVGAPQPTALEMRIDLLRAKIQAEADKIYNPSEIEYQRRLLEFSAA